MELRLDVMPEDWQQLLAIVAHPDDLEYGAASAVARWTGAGKWVGYVIGDWKSGSWMTTPRSTES